MPWGIVLLLALPALPAGTGIIVAAGAPAHGGHPLAPATPGLPQLGGPVTPRARTSFQVNPYAYYSSEPAPMGIADFGVDPSSGAGYTYNTTQFVGTVNTSSLTVLNYTNVGEIDQLSIQLNVVLVVNGSGGQYQYWIQDVAFLNTTSNLIEFIDNVWNMSSSGAYTTGTDITGNGTGYYGWYYDIAGSYLTGNDITLTYPSTFQLRVVSSTNAHGYPTVAFEYNDTGAWETYDNIIVAFAQGYYDQGFVVNGTAYNPFGLYDDAELILGGPGGGSQTTLQRSHLGLTLDYWNGHNLQPVVNAYNFGSDTAEGINHVVDQGGFLPANGTLYGVLSKGGTHGLGTLYDHGFDSLLNVSSPLAAGLVVLNGTVEASFIGNDANLTIAPGTYDLQLETPTGSSYASETIVVPAGAYVPVVFGVRGSYAVTFKETGLTTGTPWSVTLGANVSRSAGTVINLLEVNGTYPFVVSPIAGWTAAPWSGNFTVNGQAVTVGIAWTRVTYPVTFNETGLPSGTYWQVIVGGAGVNGRSSSLQIDEPNGTYAYQVSGIAGFVATPSSGSVDVAANGRVFTIAFGVATYDLTLTAHGLPSGTSWTVVVGGTEYLVLTGSVSVPLPNGTYDYQLGRVPGFTATPSNGTARISGLPIQVRFNFTEFLTPVTFTEQGLPLGTNWTVAVAGIAGSSTRSTIALDVINGSYLATVSARAPYSLAIGNVSFQADGMPVAVSVPFGPLPGWLSGTVDPSGSSVSVNGTVLVLTNGAFNVTLPIGNYTLVAQLAGYQTVVRTVTIGPGAGSSVALNLSEIPPPTGAGNGTQPIHASNPGTVGSWDLWAALGIVAAGVAAVVVVAVSRRRRDPPEPVDEPGGPVDEPGVE
jgi:hypothetical protein